MTTVLDNTKHDDMDQSTPEADDAAPSQDPGPADVKTDPPPAAAKTEQAPKVTGRTRGARRAHANGTTNGHANGAHPHTANGRAPTTNRATSSPEDDVEIETPPTYLERKRAFDEEGRKEVAKLRDAAANLRKAAEKVEAEADEIESSLGAPATKAARPPRGTPAPKRAARPAKKTAAAARKAAPATKTPRAPKGRGGRLPRRSEEDLQRALDRVTAHLKSAPARNRAEHIRDDLKMDRRELPAVFKKGLADKVLKSRGSRRATEYAVR